MSTSYRNYVRDTKANTGERANCISVLIIHYGMPTWELWLVDGQMEQIYFSNFSYCKAGSPSIWELCLLPPPYSSIR